MSANKRQQFELGKILQNAIFSIQLGIEDYAISTAPGGDTTRAISSSRNLFAGVILLFKYKLASLAKTPEEAEQLLYEPKVILPYLTEEGGIEWRPIFEQKNPRSIDTDAIHARLDSLNVEHDWEVVKTLRDCRNNLEHLHPTHQTSEIQKFLAALFPLLQNFISSELFDSPGALLGKAWETMLQTHDFFEKNRLRARAEWKKIGLPANALKLLKGCQCGSCGSPLLQPFEEDAAASLPVDTPEFRYECLVCHHRAGMLAVLEAEFLLKYESAFDTEQVVEECPVCFVHMFHTHHDICHWCETKTEYERCEHCHTILESHEAEHGTSCERCDQYQWMFDQHDPTAR